jgi:hypothetical protein
MIEPSAQIEYLLTTVALMQTPSEGMQAMMERATEFASPLEAKLTGIALDRPVASSRTRSWTPTGQTSRVSRTR